MALADILKEVESVLAPFEGLLKPELLKLEAASVAKLQGYIAAESSPDLKALFQLLASAVDSFAQSEINKLP